MAITFSNATYVVSTVGLATVAGSDATVVSIFPADVVLNGTITNPGDTLTMTINGTDSSVTATNLDNADAIVFDVGGGSFFVFSISALTPGQVITFANATLGDFVPCFAAGTRILTRRGEVAVEDLHVGDEAMALLAGGFARITWIGQRHMRCATTARPTDHWPLRVRAGAFGPGRPHRDLMLSPDHSVHVDGNLIPIRYLENGITVVRAPMAEVTYFHVELERHDVLIADGLAAESYLDTGNRADFEGSARDPACVRSDEIKARRIWAAQACAPIQTGGPVVAEARRMLDARAAALGFAEAIDPELHLVAGEQAIAPTRLGDGWQFTLPAQTAGLRLVSLAHVPAMTAYRSPDCRCLGVPVIRMLIDGRPVALDAPFLRTGWHAPEDGLRWTNGMAHLPPLRTLTLLLTPFTPRGTMRDRTDDAQASAA